MVHNKYIPPDSILEWIRSLSRNMQGISIIWKDLLSSLPLVVTYIVVGILFFSEQYFEPFFYYEISRWWATNWWSPTFNRSTVSKLTSSMPWLSLMTPDLMTELAILSWPRENIITVPTIYSSYSYFSDPHICFRSSVGIWPKWYYGLCIWILMLLLYLF